MSRIGNLPISLPSGVMLEVDGRDIKVSGPKGTLALRVTRNIETDVIDGQVIIKTNSISKLGRSLHGTTRALVANMVKGVTEGFEKKLELVGTGYRASIEGRDLVLLVGYSHPVKIDAPEGIEFKVEKSIITITGIDKELVGEIAAKTRSVRPPEPYKGKGILYLGEIVRRKAGKAAKTVGAS
jgi:large subunit ribosomal protein L6